MTRQLSCLVGLVALAALPCNGGPRAAESAAAKVGVRANDPGTWKFSLQAMAGGLLQKLHQTRPVANRPGVQVASARKTPPRTSQRATGSLRVESKPTGATVLVDGKERGKTPAALKLYEIGKAARDVRVEVRLDGYLPEAATALLAQGAQKTLRFTLRKWPPDVPPPGRHKFQTWTNPKDGSEFVFVPAGEFIMGSDDGEDDEKPAHKVYLPGYWIGKYEVTLGQFRKFMAETGHEPEGNIDENGIDDCLPVVGVSWKDAMAYARWAGCRLPTEAEWEKAVRGTDGREFVWGNAWPPPRGAGNFWEKGIKGYNDGFIGPAPVGSFPGGASPYGCLDMAGNVFEWTSSLWKPYPYRADDGREDPRTDGNCVIRRVEWSDDFSLNVCSRRREMRIYGFSDVGFRLARSVE